MNFLQSLTHCNGNGKIPELPPSSRGLGRSPFKAKTGVRISVGAQLKENRSTDDVGRFLSSIRFQAKGNLAELRVEID
jgi:hypothetical protein